jgi:DNA polymerase-3 subunit epsilon
VGRHQAIHGIGPDDIAEAPAFHELLPQIGAILDGSILVAHAARHDVAFLRVENERANVVWSCPHYLDTLALSRRAFSVPSHRLQLLASHLGIDVGMAHRADADVAVLRQLFDHIKSCLQPQSPREMWQLQTVRSLVRPQIIAQAQAAAADGGAVWLSYRPARRGVQRFRFHITAVRTDLDPPVVLGYLQHTRGRRELRVDRILRLELDGGSQGAT